MSENTENAKSEVLIEGEKVYFIVAVLQHAINADQYDKYFKVFEFTKGKVYFELIDENDLAEYQNPILVKNEKQVGVVDTVEEALRQLDLFDGKVNDNPKMVKTLAEEKARLKEKYNIS